MEKRLEMTKKQKILLVLLIILLLPRLETIYEDHHGWWGESGWTADGWGWTVNGWRFGNLQHEEIYGDQVCDSVYEYDSLLVAIKLIHLCKYAQTSMLRYFKIGIPDLIVNQDKQPYFSFTIINETYGEGYRTAISLCSMNRCIGPPVWYRDVEKGK